jgi:hypothetical protein
VSVDDTALLDCWERARSLARPWRELTLLELVDPGSASDLALLPIGERDRRLLELRTSLVGRSIECETDCPACGERLAIELDAADLRTVAPREVDRTVRHAGRRIRVRPPDSRDIAACLDEADPEQALLERCTGGRGAALPDDLREAVIRTMAALDPGAEISLDAECPACGEAWQVPLDPASLAFEEVGQLATRLLREVDQLARAYGWRERDVLELSAARRRAYVSLVAG